MMQRRLLIKKILEGGFWSIGGTKHEKFTNGEITIMVKRHREIPDKIAQKILRQAGLR